MWKITCFLRNILERIEWLTLLVVIVDDGIVMKKVKKIHVRSSHTNQPLFSCDQCGRSFNRVDHLQTHMRNCTGRGVAVPTFAVSASKKRYTGVASERLQGYNQ